MEGKKNELYTRAARLRDGGWTQFEAVTPQSMPQEFQLLPEQPPAILSAPSTVPVPASAEIPATMAAPAPVVLPEPMAMPESARVYDMPEPSIVFELDENGAFAPCATPAIVHVPVQKWGRVYEAELGMERGTIFPELDLPFLGGECNYE